MNLFGRSRRSDSLPQSQFDPATVIHQHDDFTFRISDALTGVFGAGGTGSGKSSGSMKFLARGYLRSKFGGLVMCPTSNDIEDWKRWAAEEGRTEDIRIFDAAGAHTFNPLDWEAKRSDSSGGYSINVVSLLDEIANAVTSDGSVTNVAGGDAGWFKDACHHLILNAVDLIMLAGLPVRFPLLRALVASAPTSIPMTSDPRWNRTSVCAALLREAAARTRRTNSPDYKADYRECRHYWLSEFPEMGERTRGIIVSTFSMLVRPFLTRPLRKLFGTTTSLTPEDTFSGKIILVALPVQEFHRIGKLAALAWKHCLQIALMRRKRSSAALRPVFIFADECQLFITRHDSTFQAVARSVGGCTVYFTQSRESLRAVLGDDDAVDTLLANLQVKVFHQSGSPTTNSWASSIFGERWMQLIDHSGLSSGGEARGSDGGITATSGFSTTHQKRSYLEPGDFAVLKRGGAKYDGMITCYWYNGGELYVDRDGQAVPYRLLTFEQERS